MAKIAKKKQAETFNPRSRAAKRATSPSINTDKSIKEISRADGTSPMLGVNHGSGVTKKKKIKQMTRGQRARQEKGLARAEAVMDQMESKVEDAKTRLRKRNQRKALWEEVNDATSEEQRKAAKIPGRDTPAEENQDQENVHTQNGEDIDVDTDEIDDTAGSAPGISGPDAATTPVVVHTQVPRDELDLIT